jgi:hypothetical protein
MDAPIFDPSGRPVGDAGAAAPAIGATTSGATGPTNGPVAPPSDFVPMSLDDARLLLVRGHKVAIGDDDPMLMMVTLHQAFCGDLDRLLSARLTQFSGQLDGLLKVTGNSLAEVVEQTLETLKDKTVKASLDQSFALAERQTLAMDALRRRMRWHGVLIGFLSLLAAASCGLVFAIVYNLIQ